MALGATAWPRKLNGPYKEALKEIRKRAGQAVDPEILLHFTDHSIEHFDRVKNRLVDIADSLEGTPNELNDAEWFVGLAACYLHDVALQSPKAVSKSSVRKLTEEDLQELRARHGRIAQAWIRQHVNPNEDRSIAERVPELGVTYNEEARALAEIVAQLCRYHTGEIPDDLEEEQRVSGRPIRMRFLLHLLRIADALDMDHRRVRMQFLDRWNVEAESLKYWWWHHYVADVNVDVERWLINVAMWFPDGLDPSLVSYFLEFTEEEIRRELDPARPVLRSNGIFLDIGEIFWDDEFGASRELPPRQVIDVIGKEIGSDDGPRMPEPPRVGETDEGTSWLAKWGFAGNPWTDLPTTYTDERFVLTDNLEAIFDEMDRLRDSELGELRMVFGRRGLGKTTLLKSLRSRYGEEVPVCYCDMTGVFSNDPRPREIFSYVFPKILTTISGQAVSPDSVDTESLNVTMENWEGESPLILVDNLDRYQEDVDIGTIREFFQISQGAFQALKRRALIVISATDAWRQDLESEDLNYLGPQSFINLEGFGREDAQKLIQNRLEGAGREVEEVFEPGTVDLVTKVARGNPRTILQTCEALCKAVSPDGPIRPEQVRDRYNNELQTKIAAAMIELADQSPDAQKGLEALYRFNSALERSGSEPRAGWELAEELLTEGHLRKDEVREVFTKPLAQISRTMTNLRDGGGVEARWVPHHSVRKLLDRLEDREIAVSEALSAYRIHPVYPRGSDLSKVGERFQELDRHASASRHEDTAQELFQELQTGDGSATRVLFLSRFILEHLVVASLQKKGIPLPQEYIEIRREDELPPRFGADEKKYYSRMRQEMKNLLERFQKHCAEECSTLIEMQFIHSMFAETTEKPYGERTIDSQDGGKVKKWITAVWKDYHST